MKKIISLHHLEKITDGNEAILKELLTVFIKEGSIQIQKLQTYLSDGNLQELKNVAHKIKSSLKLIGLDAYRNLAEEIEKEAEKDLQKTKQQALELVTVYTHALTELKNKLEELH